MSNRAVRQLNNHSPDHKRLDVSEQHGLGDYINNFQQILAGLVAVGAKAITDTGTVTPSATINTYGTAHNVTLDTNYAALLLSAGSVTISSIGSETVTATWTATRDDGSVTTVSRTTTTDSAMTLSDANIATLFGPAMPGGKTPNVTKLSVAVKSSIGSSSASGAVAQTMSETVTPVLPALY